MDKETITQLQQLIHNGTLLDINGVPHALVHHDYKLHSLAREMDSPKSINQTVRLVSVDSLCEYAERFKTDSRCVIFSQKGLSRIDVHFDFPESQSDPAWDAHVAQLVCEMSSGWKHWGNKDGVMLDQQLFAEHLQDGAEFIIDTPDGKPGCTKADLLGVARNLQVSEKIDVHSVVSTGGGSTELAITKKTSGKSGAKGATIEIPEIFDLALPVFYGHPDYFRIRARFFYHLRDGAVSLGYRLVESEKAKDRAFAELCDIVQARIGAPLYAQP